MKKLKEKMFFYHNVAAQGLSSTKKLFIRKRLEIFFARLGFKNTYQFDLRFKSKKKFGALVAEIKISYQTFPEILLLSLPVTHHVLQFF